MCHRLSGRTNQSSDIFDKLGLLTGRAGNIHFESEYHCELVRLIYRFLMQ